MRKVLVIDDEEATLTMFRLFLKVFGYSIFLAADGKSGIEMFKKERPEIVFTDLKMPGMDGFEVIKAIRKISSEAEIIVITGHGDMELVLQALHLDTTDFINKPIRRTALEAALKMAEERIERGDPNYFDIIDQVDGNRTLITIKGTMTANCRELLMGKYQKAVAAGVKKLILYFTDVAAVNGSGILLLSELISEALRKNQKVAVCSSSENLRTIFDMVGLTQAVHCYAELGEAIEATA